MVSVLKPSACTLISYLPGATLGMTKEPSSSVVNVLAAPREASERVPLAPGTVAPVESTTVPFSVL